jgi:hypothetical protein
MIDAIDAVAQFESSTGSFLVAVDGVSETVWRHRPAGEEWSLAETVEHVVLTDRLIRATLERVLTAPLSVDAPRFDDAAICAGMFDDAGPAPPGARRAEGALLDQCRRGCRANQSP